MEEKAPFYSIVAGVAVTSVLFGVVLASMFFMENENAPMIILAVLGTILLFFFLSAMLSSVFLEMYYAWKGKRIKHRPGLEYLFGWPELEEEEAKEREQSGRA